MSRREDAEASGLIREVVGGKGGVWVERWWVSRRRGKQSGVEVERGERMEGSQVTRRCGPGEEGGRG